MTAQKHCALTSSSIWKLQQPMSTELTTVRAFSPICILWMLKSAYLYRRVKLVFYILCLRGECVSRTSVRPVRDCSLFIILYFNRKLCCPDAAALCLQNLRKTFKYGGRKNVPLREEVQALAVSDCFIFLSVEEDESYLHCFG